MIQNRQGPGNGAATGVSLDSGLPIPPAAGGIAIPPGDYLVPPPCLAEMRVFLTHPGPAVVLASKANLRAVMAYIDALEAERQTWAAI